LAAAVRPQLHDLDGHDPAPPGGPGDALAVVGGGGGDAGHHRAVTAVVLRVVVVMNRVVPGDEAGGKVRVGGVHAAVDDGQDHQIVAGRGVPGVGEVHLLQVGGLVGVAGVVGDHVGVADAVRLD